MKDVSFTPEDELSVDPLTEEERKWIMRLQRTLAACPTSRIGLLTIGDPALAVFDENGNSQLSDGAAWNDGVVLADIVGGPGVHGVSG